MSEFVRTSIVNQIGFITLDRPKALNSLSLEMVRAITATLLDWRERQDVRAVFIHGSHERAFCAGGDIRFFHEVGNSPPTGGCALLEDFFTEEYALNHLIHFYPKPYVALMHGVVMGGGMGIAQAGISCRLRIVTEKTKMAMPEVNIGLFPDVGGGYFLSRLSGELGTYLGLTGETIDAADALYAGLADLFIPAAELPALMDMLTQTAEADIRLAIRAFAAPFQAQAGASKLAAQHGLINRCFAGEQLPAIMERLGSDDHSFAQETLAVMQKRSPLMMAVTLTQLRRGRHMALADCLRMERDMVRHCFRHGEVLEGVRALVIDKDNAPRWSPPQVEALTPELVEGFFAPVWPAYAHPLRHL